jgi:hypothetical protein
LNGCRIIPQSGPVITVIQSRNILVKGGSYPAAADVFVKVIGETSEKIHLIGVDIKQAKKGIELGANVKTDAVKQE